MSKDAASAAAALLSRPRKAFTSAGCGDCNPSGWIEDDEGKPVRRCPNCHAAAAPQPTPVSVRPRRLGERTDGPGKSTGRTASTRTVTEGLAWSRSGRTVSWSADDLLSAEFPPPRWAVPGLVPEGVTVLAGAPKAGKSWLALSLAAAVASGGLALGKVEVDAGPVLYLGLEDTGRRLQSRLGKILAGAKPPRDLTCVVECPTLPEGGSALIAGWLEANPTARMVVVDVFAKIRGRAPSGMSAYDADYNAVGHLKAVADAFAVPIVVVHHTRKAVGDDFLSDVSGTNGIAGAADSILVLRRTRGRADGVLQVTGRDVDEAEYAMTFDPDAGSWFMLDQPAEELALTDTRLTILTHLRSSPGQAPKQISEATGLAYELVKKTVKRMAADAQLHNNGRGRYFAAGESLESPASPPQVSPDPTGDSAS